MKQIIYFVLYLSAFIATTLTIILVDIPLKLLLLLLYCCMAVLAPIFNRFSSTPTTDMIWNYATGSKLIASKVYEAWVP
jgi:hypothetical protein